MTGDLDELYDATTLRRLDRASSSAATAGDSRRSGALGADRPRPRLATAVLLGALWGLQEALEGHDRHEPVIEVAPDPGAEPVRGVSLYFVPGQPEATVAVIRN